LKHHGNYHDFITKEELYDLYINKKYSSTKIGKLYNKPKPSVLKRLHDFNIPRRTPSETMRLNCPGDLSPSDDLYYFLGVMLGDGCFCKTGKYGYYINLSANDIPFIESFKTSIENLGLKYKTYTRKHRNPNHKDTYSVVTHNWKFYTWLDNLTIS